MASLGEHEFEFQLEIAELTDRLNTALFTSVCGSAGQRSVFYFPFSVQNLETVQILAVEEIFPWLIRNRSLLDCRSGFGRLSRGFGLLQFVELIRRRFVWNLRFRWLLSTGHHRSRRIGTFGRHSFRC